MRKLISSLQRIQSTKPVTADFRTEAGKHPQAFLAQQMP
jgi:hypothetical protein